MKRCGRERHEHDPDNRRVEEAGKVASAADRVKSPASREERPVSGIEGV